MKKIMFNDQYCLTKTVLEGRKTQTRRIVTYPRKYKGIDVAGFYAYRRPSDKAIVELCMYDEEEISIDEGQILPKYKIGEVVAVAQSYKDLGYSESALDRSPKDYRIVRGTLGKSKGWNNKMFVRVDACKHHIQITNVRIERLQDISDEDCLDEGIIKEVRYCFKEYVKQSDGSYIKFSCNFDTPREAYAALIDKVSGKGTWDANPYVFVYDFELVK